MHMPEEKLIWFSCHMPADVREDLRYRYLSKDLHGRYLDVILHHGDEGELTEGQESQVTNELSTAWSRVFARFVPEQAAEIEREREDLYHYEQYLERGEEAGLTHEQLREFEEELFAVGMEAFARFIVDHADEIRWTKPPETEKERQELRRIYSLTRLISRRPSYRIPSNRRPS